MDSHLPSGTVTFLFSDIEGSTYWWEQHHDWMAWAFTRQESILRAAATAHGGYVYKMIGDAFQIAFDTAPEALLAATEAQRALQKENWGEFGPLRVRMALHTGVTEERQDDYVGPILNRLGRMLSVSHGGQILLTQATYDLAADVLTDEIALLDRGTHRLKDLIRPEHIYEATASDLLSDFPPLQTLDSFPHNLPLQLTSFIGREKEILEVKRNLLGDRFVTLTGPGGTGKTRLALQVAAELLELFPDGVWFVELASISDPLLVPQTVAAVLGIRESSGRPIQGLLTDFLRNKEILLIFDNCEHLLSSAAQLTAAILQACPNVCILVTSRESLDIPGEVPIRVPSLSIPNTHQIPPIEKLIQYESIRLFVERAELIQPDFALTQVNALHVAQICHRLDGIPLAIELAVARVKMMRVEQVAERLDDRFRLLTGGSRTALPRHQTLRALIDWSYDLLSDFERTLLCRLSVFAGGWTLDAAETICTADDLQQYQVLDLLTQLVNKSLVVPDRESGSEARYRLLETIRQYARERLVEVGSGDKVRQRHLQYYLHLSEQAEPHLRGPHQIKWLDRLEKEVDNIRAALEWSMETNVSAALRIASALFWFWHIRGRKTEGIDWLERALAEDQKHPVEDVLIRGKAMNVAGSLLVMHGSPEHAWEVCEASLVLHESLGSEGRSGVAHALWNLAQGAAHHEDFDQAKAFSERSMKLYEELGDRFGVAQVLDNMGSYPLVKSDYAKAKEIWEKDLALRRELGDKDGMAWILSCLGELAFWRGDHESAKMLYMESQLAFREVGNKWAVSMALSGRGSVALAQGDFAQAAQLYEEALAFGQDMGDQNAIAGRRYDLARVAWSQGKYDLAGELYEETLVFVREQLKNKGAIAATLFELGEVEWARGNLEQAAKRYEEAMAVGREINGQFTIASALNGLGKVARARGDHATAQALQREGLLILQKVGTQWGVAYALESAMELALVRDNPTLTARLYGATQKFYEQFRFLMSPLERDHHEFNVRTARTALDDEAFSAAWEAGKSLSMDEAIQLALQELS